MLSYLKKYEKLSPEIKKKISNPEISTQISDLEDKYQIDLPSLVIKIMVKELVWSNLEIYLRENYNLPLDRARELKQDLAYQVFKDVKDYLGISEIKDKEEKGIATGSLEQTKDEEEIEEILSALEEEASLNNMKKPKETSSPKPQKEYLPQSKSPKSLPAYEHEGDNLDLTRADRYGGDWEDLVFSRDDEEELKNLGKKIDEKEKDKKQEQEKRLQDILDKIVKESEIGFSSEVSRDRFKNIILTYLKGVRTRSSALMALNKDFDKGGLGLGEKIAEKVLQISEKYSRELNSAKSGEEKIVSQEERNLDEDYFKIKRKKKKSINLQDLPERDIEYDLSSLQSEKTSQSSPETKEESKTLAGDSEDEEETKYDLANILENTWEEEGEKEEEKKKAPQVAEEEDKKEEKEEDESAEEAEEEASTKVEVKKDDSSDYFSGFSQESLPQEDKAKVTRGSEEKEVSGGKKVISDVKKAPKLVNPINELKYMDLVRFRRLGKNSQEMTSRIKEKIDNLEKKYFYRKVKGIQAWRESPVNRLYLKMGRESIVYNQPITDIIKKRKSEKKDFLTKDEFEAVMDLNNQLRYF